MSNRFDAVLVPGGGILNGTTPTPWVQKRLDRALEIVGDGLIITLSAGTTHKAPLLDEKGFALFESLVSANYLLERGFDPQRIVVEHHSYDTIGNAFFARMIHTEPRVLKRLAVVTSCFHMERTEKIFNWVFNLTPCPVEYSLDYFESEDFGLESDVLASRISGEKRRVAALEKVIPTIDTLAGFHQWLFEEHSAYAVGVSPAPMVEKEIDSY